MLLASLKIVLAHKLRLVLTAMSIVMGVAFIAGTFIFTDTIDRTFDDLFADAYAGQDVIVQTATEVDVGYGVPPPLEMAVLDVVRGVDGVEVAEGNASGMAIVYDKSGDAIVPMGPPTLGGAFAEDPRLNGNVTFREGGPPEGPGEVVVDARTVETAGYVVGDTVRIQTVTGTDDYELVGIVGFGDADNLAGATFAGFDLATAQRIMGLEGQYSGITVIADEGVTPTELSARIGLALPSGIEAVTAASEVEAQTETMQEGLSFIRIGLLVFAVVAVLVATFIIQNTFRIIVRQRQRELALFRAVGATGSQIIWMVVLEALVVALIASVVGILLGFAVSRGLVQMMAAIGWDLPGVTAPLAGRTIIIGMTVGVGVTVLAALLPAVRASRIPPVAALQDVDVQLRMSDRNRAIVGGLVMAFGIAFIVMGAYAGVEIGPLNELLNVGIGAVAVFLAVSLLSSRIVKPLARLIGWPMPKFDKVTGTLATGNTFRKPRRTATTASALMIGLALVSLFFVFGDSIKASASAAIEEGLRADYVLSVDGFAGGFSPALADSIEELPEIETTSRLRMGFWDNDGTEELLMAVDASNIEETVFLDVQQGSTEALAAGGVLIHEGVATDRGYQVGDLLAMGFSATGVQEVEIVGIYGEQNVVQSSYLVGLDFYEQNFQGYGTDVDFVLALNAAEGVTDEAARAAVESVAVDYPNANVRDQAEYRASQEAQVDQMLVMFNGLLILAVIIAMLGITNTLALSVFERTREIGLLRAVGMSRWQVRRMVLWESVIVSVIGAVLGIVVGLFFGVVITSALASQGIDVLSIPVASIVGLVVFGALVGLLASIAPARKAAKLDILESIAYE